MTTATVLVPCLDCGVASEVTMGRCHECHRAKEREKERAQAPRERPNRSDLRGPSSTAWKRLRATAKHYQNWCSDCRQTERQIIARGDRLEVDHLSSAWWKSMQHKPLDLTDVDVLCGQCNRKRGPSGPGSKRWDDWQETQRNG